MKPFDKSESNGFTVVEVIISIAIIGILVALLLPEVQTASVSTVVVGRGNNIETKDTEIRNSDLSPTSANNQGLTTLTNHTIKDGFYSEQAEGLVSEAKTVAARMELRVIQSAMDLMMIDKCIQVIKATAATSDMSAFPTGHPLFPEYLRDSNSQYKYRCNSDGKVIQTPE